MNTPPDQLQPDAEIASRLDEILSLHALNITAELDRNADFLVLRCRTASGAERVLKYCHSGSADALRRLRNEALLTRDLEVRPPLRLLRHCADGDAYLLTVFERGRPLGPADLGNPALMPQIADALLIFQTAPSLPATSAVSTRESIRRFLIKVMLKHLLHLWPRYLGIREAAAALRTLWTSLDDIEQRGVACHADLLPTNMLHDEADSTIVFVDLEGFIVANHPLYDVLSFFTIDARPLENWYWQHDFLQHYLAAAAAAFDLRPESCAFARSYRGLLTFLLVYRYNEARINAAGTGYFDGQEKLRFTCRKLLLLFSGVGFLSPGARLSPELRIRRDNLRHALDGDLFRQHLARMLAPLVELQVRPT